MPQFHHSWVGQIIKAFQSKTVLLLMMVCSCSMYNYSFRVILLKNIQTVPSNSAGSLSLALTGLLGLPESDFGKQISSFMGRRLIITRHLQHHQKHDPSAQYDETCGRHHFIGKCFCGEVKSANRHWSITGRQRRTVKRQSPKTNRPTKGGDKTGWRLESYRKKSDTMQVTPYNMQ